VKAQLTGPEQKTKSVAISIAIHVVVFMALAAITFHYPLELLFNHQSPERIAPIRYVKLTPPVTKPAAGPRSTHVASRTVAMPQPSSIPVGVPAPTVPTAPIGVSTAPVADSGHSVGIAAGLRPGIPDGRLITTPGSLGRLPETDAQKAERALTAIYDAYVDSVRNVAAHAGREPGDWSWGGKDGDKWGWDKDGIHIGGISIPNAVLAALPLNIGPTGRNMNALTDARSNAYMESDIKFHSGMMSEDEFRSAVKSIRERVDRERAEKKKEKTPPCCG
jgi:hypothetical protein